MWRTLAPTCSDEKVEILRKAAALVQMTPLEISNQKVILNVLFIHTRISDLKKKNIMTNDPIEATRITFTIKGCIARSTFLAGFTYYELGRNDFQQHPDIAYVVLNTAGFCFSVLSVGVGTFTLYYLERCRSGEQKIAFVDRANDTYVVAFDPPSRSTRFGYRSPPRCGTRRAPSCGHHSDPHSTVWFP